MNVSSDQDLGLSGQTFLIARCLVMEGSSSKDDNASVVLSAPDAVFERFHATSFLVPESGVNMDPLVDAVKIATVEHEGEVGE